MLNLNTILFPKFNKTLYNDNDMNVRAKLDTGTHCNYSCGFCYYLTELDKITSFEIIKSRIDKLWDVGILEVDLSGGESSIHKDWFRILDYCTNKGFRSISTLSNGSKFSNKEFLLKSRDHGLNEILFSMHGWEENSHDEKVNSKGAFKKIINAINNSKDLGLITRINCTVQEDFSATAYAELINKLNVDQINFLPINYWKDASGIKSVDYKILSTEIKKCIDLIECKQINVRYIPYCFMEGYEKYVVGTYQHIFDKQDWNLETYDDNDLKVMKNIELFNAFDVAKNNRKYSYTKPITCKDCSLNLICDGIEPNLLTTNILIPLSGNKVEDIQYFRRKEIIC
jgi:MoaA/NifB/PqqE/SkfB family radical SAM enzyme